MTTPEARPAAPYPQDVASAELVAMLASTYTDADDSAFYGRNIGIDGQLWEREAERDVQAHGQPTTTILGFAMRGEYLADLDPLDSRTYLAAQVERRRPAMRATRAELDALNGHARWISHPAMIDGEPGTLHVAPIGSPMPTRLEPYRCEVCEEHGVDECPAPPTRLEPEPSSMARTGLALGLAFTSDDATA